MKPGEPLKRTPMPPRKTPLTASTSGLRRTSLRQQRAGRESLDARKSSPMKRVAMAVKPRRRSTTALRAALSQRSGDVCEIQQEGCQGRAVEPCHRIGTGMGGVHGEAAAESDRLSNAVHGCRSCGRWQHDHEWLAKAFGQILPRHADPLEEPVLLRYGVVFLDDEGGYELAPPAHAKAIREAQQRRERRSA